MSDREQMHYDFVIVGAGPSGLACALRLKQLRAEASICVLEKGSTVGAHSISGAVLEPGPLEALLPNWRTTYSGMAVPAQQDEFCFLTASKSLRLPLPPTMRNHGNVIVSLSQLTAWLAQQAEGLGIDIFPGFAAAAPLYGADGAVTGVQIGDMGLTKDGGEGPNFTPGVEILAGTTILAEGAIVPETWMSSATSVSALTSWPGALAAPSTVTSVSAGVASFRAWYQAVMSAGW